MFPGCELRCVDAGLYDGSGSYRLASDDRRLPDIVAVVVLDLTDGLDRGIVQESEMALFLSKQRSRWNRSMMSSKDTVGVADPSKAVGGAAVL